MSEREKKIAEKLAAACEQLPDGKKEFLMGYAEGVAAMAASRQAGENPVRMPVPVDRDGKEE